MRSQSHQYCFRDVTKRSQSSYLRADHEAHLFEVVSMKRCRYAFAWTNRPAPLEECGPEIASARIDVGTAELEQANEQQHQSHSRHAQEIRPVNAEEDRVAVHVED